MSVCIEETRRTKPSLSGTVEAEVAVTETSVKSVVVTDGSLTDAAVRDCVIEGLARAKYAGSRGTVRYSMSILARWFWPVKLTELAFHVRGKLARETVQRIVRANFPRLSLCYQQALEAVPTLKGTVVAGFSIDKFGAVTAACVDAKSSTLPDAGVRSCMLGVYRSLTFPEP